MSVVDRLLWWTGLAWWTFAGFVVVMAISVAVAEWVAGRRPQIDPVDREWLADHGISVDGRTWTGDR